MSALLCALLIGACVDLAPRACAQLAEDSKEGETALPAPGAREWRGVVAGDASERSSELVSLSLSDCKRAGLNLATLKTGGLQFYAGEQALASLWVDASGKARVHGEPAAARDRIFILLPRDAPTGIGLLARRRHLRILEAQARDFAVHEVEEAARDCGWLESTFQISHTTRATEFLELRPPIGPDEDPRFWKRLMSTEEGHSVRVVYEMPGRKRDAQGTVEFQLVLFARGAMPGRAIVVQSGGVVICSQEVPASGFLTVTFSGPPAGAKGGGFLLVIDLTWPADADSLVQVYLQSITATFTGSHGVKTDHWLAPLAVVDRPLRFGEFESEEVIGAIMGLDAVGIDQQDVIWLKLPSTRNFPRDRTGRSLGLGALPELAASPDERHLAIYGVDSCPAVVDLTPLSPCTALPAKRDRARLLVIAHHELAATIEPLLKLRQKEGFDALVIDPRDAYARTGDGRETAAALRREIMARLGVPSPAVDGRNSWQQDGETRVPHLLLVGGASMDPDRVLPQASEKSTALLPCFYVATREMVTGSDAGFADRDGDGIADLAIGRLPASDPETLARVVAKTIAAAKAPEKGWGGVVLAADDRDEKGKSDFKAVAQKFFDSLPPAAQQALIVQDAAADPGAFRAQLKSEIDRGASWISYVGHGSITSWGHEVILDRKDVSALFADGAAATRLPLVVAAFNCLNAHHSHQTLRCLAEVFLETETSRVTGVLGSTTLAGASRTFAAAGLLHDELARATPETTLGELVLRTLAVNAADPDFAEIRNTWILLGDPCQRVPRISR